MCADDVVIWALTLQLKRSSCLEGEVMSLNGDMLNLRSAQDIWTDTPGEYLGMWSEF